MIKILFITPSITDSCSFYRSGGISADLSRKLNCTIDVVDWRTTFHWQLLMGYDLVMMQRAFSNEAVNLLSYLKQMQIPVWADYDDNLMAVPPENPQFRIYGAESRENIRKILEGADVVSVTNKALADSFADYNPNIKIIPNAFNDFLFKNKSLNNRRAKLVLWRGGASHILDIMSQASSINKITEDFKDWQFLFLGYNPWHLAERNNLFYIDPMDVVVYFNHVKKMGPVLMQVPLQDSLFNRCKSNIAYIEATYFGALTLGPNWDDWRLPGIVHYGNYYESMRAVLQGEIDIDVNVKIAWQYILDELSLSKVNVKRIELINSLI